MAGVKRGKLVCEERRKMTPIQRMTGSQRAAGVGLCIMGMAISSRGGAADSLEKKTRGS
jgi:hypothetical protein